MPDIASNIQAVILPTLGQEPGLSNGLKSWLLKGQYGIDRSENSADLKFDQVRLDNIIPYISFDFERFALASWETFSVATLESSGKGLVGWPLIKLYYSGFYAAHAIMRACGSGVVVLDGKLALEIGQIAQAYGVPAGVIGTGQYSYEVSSSSSDLSVVLSPMVTRGGVHESFWTQFCAFLDRTAEQSIMQAAPESANFLAGVVDVVDALSYPGAKYGGWLSKIRNDINYQQMYESWYPFPKTSQSVSAISGVCYKPSGTINIGSSKEKNPVKGFVEASVYLACLCFEISDFVSKRSTKGKAFGQKWRRLLEAVK